MSGIYRMHRVFAVLALGLVTACAPAVPDSGPKSQGVNSPEQQRARDAALANPGLPSPYAISGEPSGALTFGTLCGKDVVFLARHGYAHTIPPHMVYFKN